MTSTRSFLWFGLLFTGVLALSACDGGDDDSPDAARDTGVDSGIGRVDATVIEDSGVREDTGTLPPDSGESNCLPAETVDVNGTDVVVDPASTPPTTTGGEAVLSCRLPGVPQFADDVCLVECLDFFGYTPTQAEVDQLEFAAFRLFDIGTMTPIDADPTYDRTTGIDNDPVNRVPIGYAVTAPPNSECESGFQLELAFLAGPGAGAAVLAAETQYALRVRSTQTSTPAWADTYHWRFIRRNDETPDVAGCNIDEARTPGVRYTFPVLHRTLLEQAIASAGAAVPGSANLDDGLGSGYLMVETRDCSSGGGLPMANATLGVVPSPIGDVYPGAELDLNRNGLFTDTAGHWLGIGFAQMTATSSMTYDVTGAVGISSDGTCTEAFAGGAIRIFPDALTYFRFNREDSIIR